MNPQRAISVNGPNLRIVVNSNQHPGEPHRPEPQHPGEQDRPRPGQGQQEGDNLQVRANQAEPREVLNRQQARRRFAEWSQPLLGVNYRLPPGQEFYQINSDSDDDIFDRETVYDPLIQVHDLIGVNYRLPPGQEFYRINSDSDDDIFDRETVYDSPIRVYEISSTTPDFGARALLGDNYRQPPHQESHFIS